MCGSLLLSSVVAFTHKYATTLPNFVISAYYLVYASESIWRFLYLFIFYLDFSNEVLVLVLLAGNNCLCPSYIITERYLLLKVELQLSKKVP